MFSQPGCLTPVSSSQNSHNYPVRKALSTSLSEESEVQRIRCLAQSQSQLVSDGAMICINPVSVCFYFILPHSMWDLSSAPRPPPQKKRWNPYHLHWKCQVLTTGPPGMSLYVILVHHIILPKMGKIDDTGVIQIAHIETILLIWNDVHGILK